MDGTHKWSGEAERAWPQRIEMTADMRRLVDERWRMYGIEGVARHDNGARASLLS